MPTLLAAHVVPQEYAGKADDYVKKVCDEMIPLVAKKKLAKYVDVFLRPGSVHAGTIGEEFWQRRANMVWGRAPMSASSRRRSSAPLLEYQPASFDHMDCVQPEDISLLARGETVAVLLPGANYFLGHKEFPDARRLIDAGVPLALATDYNPGTSPTPSMPFVVSLACTHMKMTPAEAIAASTINAACALRMQGRKGQPGSRERCGFGSLRREGLQGNSLLVCVGQVC